MLHYRFVKIDRTFNYNELAEFGSQTSLSAYIKSLVPKLIQLGDFLFYRDAVLSPLVGQQPRECARNITTILQQSTDFTAAI